jgi:hypothetical protein
MQEAAGDIIENRFKQENGAVLIEIKLREVRQIFNSLDPAPFHEKDLDEAAEKYITDALSEFELSRPVRIVVYLPAEAAASLLFHLQGSTRTSISTKRQFITTRTGRTCTTGTVMQKRSGNKSWLSPDEGAGNRVFLFENMDRNGRYRHQYQVDHSDHNKRLRIREIPGGDKFTGS